MGSAIIPRGCAWIDCCSSPWSKYDIEWPIPHPGQKPIPRFLKRHRLKCGSLEGLMHPRKRIAAIHIHASTLRLRSINGIFAALIILIADQI
jgi:hypothetical protein